MKFFGWMLIGLIGATAAFAESPKIAYVDLQRALNECDAGKKAKDEFKGTVDKVQGRLKSQKDEIERLKDQIEKKALVVKQEERAGLEEDYRKKLRDFERNYKDTQADLQRKDQELTGWILKDLQDVIREVGERGSYTLILEATSSAVLYGSKDSDLTESIIQEYNSKGSSRKK